MRLMLIGGLATIAVAAAPAGAEDAARVDVTLSSFAFAPKTIALQHGRSYVLHLVNSSDGGHDFVAKRFFAAARLGAGDRAVATSGEVELTGGESRDIAIVAPAAGSYEVHCSHFMHSAFGMNARIVVS